MCPCGSEKVGHASRESLSPAAEVRSRGGIRVWERRMGPIRESGRRGKEENSGAWPWRDKGKITKPEGVEEGMGKLGRGAWGVALPHPSLPCDLSLL